MPFKSHVSWQEHVLAILEERHCRYEERFHASQQALRTALDATERRFESVNEFRATLSDQAARFATLDQLETHRIIVSALAARLDKMEGSRSGLSSGWTILVAALGIGVAVVALVLR